MGEEQTANGKRVTSYDVAEKAGVSQITVSRVFNARWNGKIRPATREKVLCAAQALGYSPNALARGLSSRESNLIAFVMHEEYNAFFSELLCLITNRLILLKKQVMVYYTAPDSDINSIIRKLDEYSIEGIILCSSAHTNQISSKVIENSPSLVLLNSNPQELECCCIYCDSFEGSRKVADYLMQTGHRKYVFLSSGHSVFSTHVQRQLGFVSRLKEFGIECRVIEADYTYASGAEAARIVYEGSQEKPDAVFCSNDLVAMGYMDTARGEYGVRIPEDVSVVGFDDQESASYGAYSLTSVHQDLEELAAGTVRLIMDQIRNPGREMTRIQLIPELVVRGSTMDRSHCVSSTDLTV